MKVVPLGGDHPIYTVEEAGRDYLRLLGAARLVASQIIETPSEGLTGAASYIHGASQELLTAVGPETEGTPAEGEAILECLRKVASAWPELAAGRIRGEQVFSGDPTLWKRAMSEWPMGGFAQMAADFMIEYDLLGGNIVELGAGVGSCSNLVAGHVTDRFIRTDLQPALLKRQKIRGTVERYDFNTACPWENLDAIFAVNALHCARDKFATLRYLFDALRHGGVVVLGEGIPYTDERGTPWALNLFFGLFSGWWDIGGFLPRSTWLNALRQAGFSDVGFAARRAGAHDLAAD